MATKAEETQPKSYVRFSASDRMEHFVLLVAFTMLGVTGLPQRYAADYQIAKDMIGWLGGIESVRVMHRFFAMILIGSAIYHGGVLSYKIYVRGVRLTMIPGPRDVQDAIQVVLYNLGLRKEHPKMPRYNFGEKAEYLAVVWGTVLMIITGFMMWNPVATAKFFPGGVIPAARLAHSAEAALAFASIIIWHMYNVHVKRFNRAMFTGKVSHEEMEEEHGEELEEIEKGENGLHIPHDILTKRLHRFMAFAVVMTVILVATTVYFVSFEETAIETVPRQPVPVEEIDASIGDPVQGAEVWQSLPCQECHGADAEGAEPIPALRGIETDILTFETAIRRGPADMHAFTGNQLSTNDIAHLYAYLRAPETE